MSNQILQNDQNNLGEDKQKELEMRLRTVWQEWQFLVLPPEEDGEINIEDVRRLLHEDEQ